MKKDIAKTTIETDRQDPSEWQELAEICMIITTRAESNSPRIPRRMRVSAMLREAQAWVTSRFLQCLSFEKPIPEVQWSSLYTTGTVQSITDPQFPPIKVHAAYNLFGGDSIATYHPAICPILTIQQIQDSLKLYQEMSKQGIEGFPPHPLSISELCRISNRPITCYVDERDNMIIYILNVANANPADTRTHELLTAIEEVADGNHVILDRSDDRSVSAIITIRNAPLFLEQGAVYQRARKHDKYSPPQSSLMIPYSVGDNIILQLGFKADVNPFSNIQSFLPALEGANIILGIALNRAFNSQESLSQEVRRILRSLMKATRHDIGTQHLHAEMAIGSAVTIMDLAASIFQQLAEGIPFSEIASQLPQAYNTLETLTDAFSLIAQQLKKVPSSIHSAQQLVDYLLELATNTTKMAKLRTVQLFDEIQKEIDSLINNSTNQGLSISIASTISKQECLAVEFAGAVGICVRNLAGNAVKAWQSEPDHETPLEIKIIITEEELNGTEYYRITVADSGQGIPQDQIASILDDRVKQVTSSTGTGYGLKNVRAIVEAQAPNAPVELVFTVTNGIPESFLDILPKNIQHQVENLQGACVSFLIPQVAPVNP